MEKLACAPDILHRFGELTVIVLRGTPLFPASAIEAELGYRPGRLREYVADDARWGREFELDRDYVYIEGEDLRAIKTAYAQTPNLGVSPISKNAPRILAFTRRGVDLISIKTDKAEGDNLRARLVDEVFPALRERGVYYAHKRTRPVKPAPEIDAKTQALIDREKRLARQLKERGYRTLAKSCRRRGLAEAVVAVLDVKAAEAATGDELSQFLPVQTERWWTPTEIAEELGATPKRIGTLITELGIRGKPGYSRAVDNKSRHSNRSVTSFQYNATGRTLIVDEFNAWRAAAN